MIELVDITKRYPGKFTLHIDRLTLAPGGRYALLGPNGSGKTTLLRLLAGAIPANCGMGTVKQSGIAQRNAGYLPQSPHLFDVSVLQNVLLNAPGATNRDKMEQSVRTLEAVGLLPRKDARAKSLSGGERQRLALARLLVRPYDLLLLDEPTAAIDIDTGDRIESEIANYCDITGCTLLFSCHAPSLALRLAQEALVLYDGALVERGKVEEVLLHPQTECAQNFLRHWLM